MLDERSREARIRGVDRHLRPLCEAFERDGLVGKAQSGAGADYQASRQARRRAAEGLGIRDLAAKIEAAQEREHRRERCPRRRAEPLRELEARIGMEDQARPLATEVCRGQQEDDVRSDRRTHGLVSCSTPRARSYPGTRSNHLRATVHARIVERAHLDDERARLGHGDDDVRMSAGDILALATMTLALEDRVAGRPVG